MLDWDGLVNLRDLGGLPTPLSPTGFTAFGRVARGPRREFLTTAGWVAADRWGLRTVVDLRNVNEVGPRPTDPVTTPPGHLRIVLAPTEDQTHPEFREMCLSILDSPEYWRHNIRILPELVRNTLETIASAEPGILVHCAAGRDRTGLVSALLLANAGVPSEDIWTDYATSVRAMAGTSVHGAPAHDRQAGWGPQQVEDWLRRVSPFVHDFVADLDSVVTELGLRQQTQLRLRDLLIGPRRPARHP